MRGKKRGSGLKHLLILDGLCFNTPDSLLYFPFSREIWAWDDSRWKKQEWAEIYSKKKM